MIVDYSGGYNILKGKAKDFSFSIYDDVSVAYNPSFAAYSLEKEGTVVDSGNCGIVGNVITAAISYLLLSEYATGMGLLINFGRAYPYPDEEFSHTIVFNVVKNAINNPVTAAALCADWPKLARNAADVKSWQAQINRAYEDTLSDLARVKNYIYGVTSSGDLGKLFRLNAAYYCFRSFSGDEYRELAADLKKDYERELATVQFWGDFNNDGNNQRRRGALRATR
jgi:hypothetical protein